MRYIPVYELNDVVEVLTDEDIYFEGDVVHRRLQNGTATFDENKIEYIVRYAKGFRDGRPVYISGPFLYENMRLVGSK
jgi:hypothetical protein